MFQQSIVDHPINSILRVVQDERDLNHFAYVSQDGRHTFCHVFCVLTAVGISRLQMLFL